MNLDFTIRERVDVLPINRGEWLPILVKEALVRESAQGRALEFAGLSKKERRLLRAAICEFRRSLPDDPVVQDLHFGSEKKAYIVWFMSREEFDKQKLWTR